MHHPTSYSAAPLLLDASPELDPDPDPDPDEEPLSEDPLSDPALDDPEESPVAPLVLMLVVDGSVEMLIETGRVVMSSSPVDVPSVDAIGPVPSSPHPTVANAQTITIHLEVGTHPDMSRAAYPY